MKWIFFCFIVFTLQVSFAQSSVIEKRYKEEQKKLVEFEQKLNQLKQTLTEKGEIPKDNFDYVGLESQYKLQKKNFKIAEKAWKIQQKEALKQQVLEEKQKAEQLKKQQLANARQENQSASTDLITMTDKEKVKVLKKDIKRLQAYKKQLIQEAIETQQNPANNSKIQETETYIVKKQTELISLGYQVKAQKENKAKETKPINKKVKQKQDQSKSPAKAENTKPSQQTVDVAGEPQALVDEVKQMKKEIRTLKKKGKEIDFQIYSDPENSDLLNQKSEINKKLLVLQQKLEILKAKEFSANQSEKINAKQVKKKQKEIKQVEQNLPDNAPLVIDEEKVESLKNQLKQLKNQKKELSVALKSDPQNQTVHDELLTTLRLIDAVKQQISIEKKGKFVEQAQVNTTQKPISSPLQENQQQQQAEINSNSTPEVNVKTEEVAVDVPAIGLNTILFDKFSSEIKESYHLYLNHIAKQLIEHPHLVLSINAYTDNSEKERVSRELTAKMAKEVARAFLKRGIPAERLIVKARGSKNPVGDNKTYFGQIRNRRVELSFQ